MKRKVRLSSYSRFMTAVVKWLDAQCLRSGARHLGLEIIDKYLTILRTRGKREAIRYCKDARASIYSLLASNSLSEIPKPPSGSPRRYRIPKALRSSMARLSTADYPKLRLVLSALYASRELTLPATPNVESIVSPSAGKEVPGLFDYLGDFWNELGIRRSARGKVPSHLHRSRFHLTTKAGPNGHALWGALADLYALPDDLFETIGRFGGEELAKKMQILRNIPYPNFLTNYFRGPKPERIRRISAIPSQEGKTREVAIMDYWSQVALKPLHRYLFAILKRIPQDCTFDQGSFVDKLSFDGEEEFHSLDLSSATDRFPIEVICRVLEARFTSEYVADWRTIMVGYPFWTREHGEIRYAVGNPMGAYSSWNSFAIAHHYVIYYCCRKLKLKWSKAPYVILGDDVVIKHNALAKMYTEVITQLGVEISVQKSHSSPYLYEFAKRIIYQGVELTPFPISALWTTRKQRSLMLNIVDSELRKGWTFDKEIPAAIAELYILLGLPKRVRDRIEKMLMITYSTLRVIRGNESARSALKRIVESYFPNLDHVLDQLNLRYAKLVWQLVIIGLQQSSLDSTKRSKYPLGKVPEDLLILITGKCFDDPAYATVDVCDLIQAVPILPVYGQIEEQYLKMRKGVSTIENLVLGDWKVKMRSFQLPESDRMFYMRNQDIMVQASFAIAKSLIGILNKLASKTLYEVASETLGSQTLCKVDNGPVWSALY